MLARVIRQVAAVIFRPKARHLIVKVSYCNTLKLFVLRQTICLHNCGKEGLRMDMGHRIAQAMDMACLP